jgi:hypothetical protein
MASFVTPALSGDDALLHWEVEAVLAWHDDDARAAIETLLLDCKHLRRQLALAEAAMSHGMVRGWTPAFERK